jgi:hypothetical protein
MKTIKITTIAFLIFVLPLISLGQGSVPPPPSDHGQSDNQSPNDGGTAPIGGGVAMLLTMGAAYGGKKYYDYRKKLNNEMEE